MPCTLHPQTGRNPGAVKRPDSSSCVNGLPSCFDNNIASLKRYPLPSKVAVNLPSGISSPNLSNLSIKVFGFLSATIISFTLPFIFSVSANITWGCLPDNIPYPILLRFQNILNKFYSNFTLRLFKCIYLFYSLLCYISSFHLVIDMAD